MLDFNSICCCCSNIPVRFELQSIDADADQQEIFDGVCYGKLVEGRRENRFSAMQVRPLINGKTAC